MNNSEIASNKTMLRLTFSRKDGEQLCFVHASAARFIGSSEAIFSNFHVPFSVPLLLPFLDVLVLAGYQYEQYDDKSSHSIIKLTNSHINTFSIFNSPLSSKKNLFPTEKSYRKRINNRSPNKNYQNIEPSVSQRSTVKTNAAHGIIKMRER